MTSTLSYRATAHPKPANGSSAIHVGRILQTGTLLVGGSASAPIDVPTVADGSDVAVTFEIVGDPHAWVSIAIVPAGQAPAPKAFGPAIDASPRVVITGRSGPVTIPVVGGARFAAIEGLLVEPKPSA